MAAKKLGDAAAARKIVEFFLKEETVFSIGDCIRQKNTYVVAPARTFHEPSNMIPHVYAAIIAQEFGVKLCTSIYQYDGPKRDASSLWERFSNSVVYHGNIFEGADYIIVDDVFSTGSTAAALKGFIESQGGNVICISALASASGENVPIAIDPRSLSLLNSRHGSGLRSFMEMEIGYGPECLTEPEADALLSQRTLDLIRKKVTQARHQ